MEVDSAAEDAEEEEEVVVDVELASRKTEPVDGLDIACLTLTCRPTPAECCLCVVVCIYFCMTLYSPLALRSDFGHRVSERQQRCGLGNEIRQRDTRAPRPLRSSFKRVDLPVEQ